MTREDELQKIKEIMKDYFSEAECGLYNTRNVVGDTMVTVFIGEYFMLDICFNYSYFEVFGTTDDEFEILEEYYEKLGEAGGNEE